MRTARQRVYDLATGILGPGKLRMMGEGEFFWIADDGRLTHLGWNLALAEETLRSMERPGDLPATAKG
jgi:hypothetical protein